jgi:cyclophilin family peptidyl-prolyl cis-trans isomerase
MRFLLPGLLVVACIGAVDLLAQALVPAVTQPLPPISFSAGGSAVTIDIRSHITVPGVMGTQFARFETVLGRFSVELRNDVAPRHTANFLSYAASDAYNNSFIHRSATFDSSATSIVQGGGYRVPLPVTTIPKLASVPLEYNLPNARGTLAAARQTDANSATSEWYFNVRDNSSILGQNNSGGYTVFGRVLGTGMTVVDAMAATPRFNAGSGNAGSPFTELPLRNYTTGEPTEANLIVVTAITPVTLFPTSSGASVIELSVQNSAPSVVSTVLLGSALTITPVSSGAANITVRAVDINGNAAAATFTATVASAAPVFISQPMALSLAVGSTVIFNGHALGAASYRWERNGTVIETATTATLVLNNASRNDDGAYRVIAVNSIGSATSESAILNVVATDPLNIGRLVNLSILTLAGSGAKVLTMGAFIGGAPAGALPLVIRGVGPTLAQAPFNVAGVLPDPVMTFYAAGNTAPLETNDNWGGSSGIAAAFRSVAAFDLPANSLDSAIVRPAPGVAPGGYTVQVTGKGDASGEVIAEIYEASGEARTTNTPRLINLSTRAEINANATLAVGFVLGGQTARTVLVRGVGPSLATFNIPGVMVDPRLELFNNSSGARIAANDDWAGGREIAAASDSVGAFSLTGGDSKDAVLLLTLPPGPYSARVSGTGGAGGTAIVEVYEVP